MTSAAEYHQSYWRDVLGIQWIPRQSPQRPRVLVIDLPSPEGLAKNDMFGKMMGAIDLRPEQIQVREFLVSEIEGARAELTELSGQGIFILSFSDELSQRLLPLEITTLKGPRDLMTQPQLKRATWNGLQDLAKKLKSSP